ncbi:hypothetical protein HY338_03765 [Candidatus Gottesmanbacteria bacterium]|nr:hypothetical protein [Candidatus Gottesmanbacteria bacterium]
MIYLEYGLYRNGWEKRIDSGVITSLQNYLEGKKEQMPTLGNGVIISFVGIPAAGKTTMSEMLMTHLNCPRVAYGEMNNIINPEDSLDRQLRRDIIMGKFIPFVEGLTHGECFIYDKGNDRDLELYEKMKSVSRGRLFIIAIDIPKDVAHDRIMARNNWQPNDHVEKLDFWIAQYDRFIAQFEGDINLRLDGCNELEENWRKTQEALKFF